MVDAAVACNAAAVVAYRDWYLICTGVNNNFNTMKQAGFGMNTAGIAAKKALNAVLNAVDAAEVADDADECENWDDAVNAIFEAAIHAKIALGNAAHEAQSNVINVVTKSVLATEATLRFEESNQALKNALETVKALKNALETVKVESIIVMYGVTGTGYHYDMFTATNVSHGVCATDEDSVADEGSVADEDSVVAAHVQSVDR